MNKKFYEIEAIKLNGEKVKMEDYKGKTVLVVNTATKCGLAPQFEGLESLYQEYKDQGLVVLGFPSNQFANQEPGSDKEIEQACQLNYGVSFPMFSKIKVNGPEAHPLFKYLKSELKGFLGGAIKWNFTKFLIDKNGQPVKRFAPTTKPDKIKQFIEKRIGHETS